MLATKSGTTLPHRERQLPQQGHQPTRRRTASRRTTRLPRRKAWRCPETGTGPTRRRARRHRSPRPRRARRKPRTPRRRPQDRRRTPRPNLRPQAHARPRTRALTPCSTSVAAPHRGSPSRAASSTRPSAVTTPSSSGATAATTSSARAAAARDTSAAREQSASGSYGPTLISASPLTSMTSMSTPFGSSYSPAASDHSTCCLAHESMLVVSGAPFTTRCDRARMCRLSRGTPRRAMRQRHTSAGSARVNFSSPRSCSAQNVSYAAHSSAELKNESSSLTVNPSICHAKKKQATWGGPAYANVALRAHATTQTFGIGKQFSQLQSCQPKTPIKPQIKSCNNSGLLDDRRNSFPIPIVRSRASFTHRPKSRGGALMPPAQQASDPLSQTGARICARACRSLYQMPSGGNGACR